MDSVEDVPVFELAHLGGSPSELQQGAGQVFLRDLLAGQRDGQRDLGQHRGRLVVNRAVVRIQYLAGDDLGAWWKGPVDRKDRTGHADALPCAQDFLSYPVPLRLRPANLGVSVVHSRTSVEKTRVGLMEIRGAKLRQ